MPGREGSNLVGLLRKKQLNNLWPVALIALPTLVALAPARADGTGAALPIRVQVQPLSFQVPRGQPVWVSFSVLNESNDPLTLTVPGTKPRIPEPEISLPLSHIFSGGDTGGVAVMTESGHEWDRPVGFRAKSEAPILLLAPHGSVGRTLDLRDYFPALRSPGKHRVTWKPYGPGGPTASAMVSIASRKQVEITTNFGVLKMELFYDDAPQTVENFVELVQQGFYEGLKFHYLIPGYVIQGGCRHGDGTGVRADGKRIVQEFSGRPHERGSVSMALLEDQPGSASTQFFISNTRMEEWDGRYTVFAHLIGEESYATLEKLMATPVDEQNRPRETLYMRAVRAYSVADDAAEASRR